MDITRWFVNRDAEISQEHLDHASKTRLGRQKDFHQSEALRYKKYYQSDLEFRKMIRENS